MTNPPDGQRLRDSWNALAADATGTPQVDDEAVWRTVAGEGDPDERLAVVDAVGHDPAAAESWRLAQELQRELAAREPNWTLTQPGGSPARPLFRRQQQWAALAAMLLLALGLGFWRLSGPSSTAPEGPVFRDSSVAELQSLVPEDVPQPRDRLILSWSDAGKGAPAPGTRYSVRLLRSNLETVVALRDLTTSSVHIPAERLREVAAGERLLWQVEAHRPGGQTVTSPTFFLDLVPTTNSATESSTPLDNLQ